MVGTVVLAVVGTVVGEKMEKIKSAQNTFPNAFSTSAGSGMSLLMSAMLEMIHLGHNNHHFSAIWAHLWSYGKSRRRLNTIIYTNTL